MTKPTALLVDDDRLLRQVLKDLLQEAGFRVIEAQNGAEGCRMAFQNPPDVILMDLEMPELNGIEACRLLRSDPRLNRTPILVLTARSDHQQMVNPFLVGADDYLTKPFDQNELLTRIWGNLTKKRTIEDLEGKLAICKDSESMSRFIRDLEDELRVKAVYEELFENASEGLAAFNRRGALVFANRQALNVVGYDKCELRGRSFANLLNIPSLRQFLKRHRKGGSEGSSHFDVSITTKSGEVRLLSVSMNEKPLCDGLRVVAFRDVTEKRRMESELQATKATLERANERLRELDSVRSRFLNTAAHELRIPVTIVNGYCSLLQEMGTENLTVQQREFLDAAIESSDRLVDLINNILDLSRFEAGKMLLDLDVRDLPELVRGVCRDFKAMITKNGLDFALDVPSTTCRAYFDHEKIERVLTNLIGNAIKFTPTGGQIRVAIAEGNDEVQVTIEDTGRGIPGERISELFDEFAQLGPADSSQGSGLGLSICKKIVDSHSGRIWVVSTLGQGSRFTFTLPKQF